MEEHGAILDDNITVQYTPVKWQYTTQHVYNNPYCDVQTYVPTLFFYVQGLIKMCDYSTPWYLANITSVLPNKNLLQADTF